MVVSHHQNAGQKLQFTNC